MADGDWSAVVRDLRSRYGGLGETALSQNAEFQDRYSATDLDDECVRFETGFFATNTYRAPESATIMRIFRSRRFVIRKRYRNWLLDNPPTSWTDPTPLRESADPALFARELRGGYIDAAGYKIPYHVIHTQIYKARMCIHMRFMYDWYADLQKCEEFERVTTERLPSDLQDRI